jgi:hydroxymethylpyrimidine pyrophosphatase-like HAD family hydrolase
VKISALATDYDGTLASDGEVSATTLQALRRFKASGRKLVMVTGRQLPDLRRVFAHAALFDAVVAENGALLFQLGETRRFAPPPPPDFVAALRRRGLAPLAVGEVIVATSSAHAADVAEAIAEAAPGWHAILNKDSVMCLPSGVDKASGLIAAAGALELDLDQVAGVGDAENDLTFLAACGVGAAVANALPEVKAAADLVTPGPEGDGVVWLIDRILAGWTGDAAHRAAAG